ncbi:hypothetical protein IX324_002660 [Bacteroides pyogenes]|nr:hypothetical protein [Bacteroides pyogenes]
MTRNENQDIGKRNIDRRTPDRLYLRCLYFERPQGQAVAYFRSCGDGRCPHPHRLRPRLPGTSVWHAFRKDRRRAYHPRALRPCRRIGRFAPFLSLRPDSRFCGGQCCAGPFPAYALLFHRSSLSRSARYFSEKDKARTAFPCLWNGDFAFACDARAFAHLGISHRQNGVYHRHADASCRLLPTVGRGGSSDNECFAHHASSHSSAFAGGIGCRDAYRPPENLFYTHEP